MSLYDLNFEARAFLSNRRLNNTNGEKRGTLQHDHYNSHNSSLGTRYITNA